MEDFGGGRVAQGPVFPGRRMVDEASVEHPAERASPAEVAFVIDANLRAAERSRPGRPVAVVVMAVAAASGEGAVARHHGEILRAILVAEKFHGEGDAGVLAVAVVCSRGREVAIRNGTQIHIGTEVTVGALDGLVDLGVLDAEFPGERDEEEAAVAGRIERAVAGVHAMELAAVEGRVGESVPPAAAGALPQGGVDGVFFQRGEHEVVAGGLVVERAVQPVKSVMPALVALVAPVAGLEHRAGRLLRRMPLPGVRAAHPLLHDLAVLRFARGHQRDGFQHPTTTAPRVPRIGDKLLLQYLPRLLEDLRGLRAVVGRGVAVVGEGAQGQLDLEGRGVDRELVEALRLTFARLFRFPLVERVVVAGLGENVVDIDADDVLRAEALDVVLVAPDQETDLPTVRLPLRLDDRVSDQVPEVAAAGELLTIQTDDDIAGEELALGWRPF